MIWINGCGGGGVGGPLGSHSSGDLFSTSALTTVSKAAFCVSTALCLVFTF